MAAQLPDHRRALARHRAEPGRKSWIRSHAAPEIFRPFRGFPPRLRHRGQRWCRGELAFHQFSLAARRPKHRQHIVGGRAPEWQRVIEEKREIPEMHVRVSDQLPKGVQPLDRGERSTIDQSAPMEFRRRFEPVPRQRADQRRGERLQQNHPAPPARPDPVEARDFKKTTASCIKQTHPVIRQLAPSVTRSSPKSGKAREMVVRFTRSNPASSVAETGPRARISGARFSRVIWAGRAI